MWDLCFGFYFFSPTPNLTHGFPSLQVGPGQGTRPTGGHWPPVRRRHHSPSSSKCDRSASIISWMSLFADRGPGRRGRARRFCMPAQCPVAFAHRVRGDRSIGCVSRARRRAIPCPAVPAGPVAPISIVVQHPCPGRVNYIGRRPAARRVPIDTPA